MSPTALRGQHQPRQGDDQRDASRTKLAHSIGSLCPDELAVYNAVREAGGYISPSKLHAIYERVTASADADFDFGAQVLTFMRRRQSIPVDTTTGERATKRLDKQRSYR